MPIELGSAYGKIIIDASGVKRGTGEAKKEIGDFQKAFSTASKSIVTASGLITGEIALLKKAFDFGREGAMVVQTAESFDTLMDSIGGPKDLLEQLQRASQGTVATMKLQSATTTLLAGTSEQLGRELAGNAAGILEIAKAANKLNPSLGSTEFLYQSLMTGIKRGSPMIIDNTGITLKLGEAYEALAKELGKNADELTSEEQKMAILRATMEAGGRIIEQVGGNTASATDRFDRMTTAIIEQGDKLKTKLLPPLQDAADAIYYMITAGDAISEMLIQHEGDLRRSGMSWEEYIRELGRAGVASRKFTQGEGDAGVAMALNTGKVNDLTAYYKLADVEIDILTEDQYKWVAAVANGTVTVQTYGDGLVNATTKAGAFADAIPRMTMSMEELELFMAGPLGEEFDNFELREKDLNTEAGNLQAAIDELSAKPWLSSEQKGQLEDNKKKLEEIQAQIKANADEHALATKRILFDLLQQQLAMDGLTTEEGNALAVVAEKWGLIDQDTAQAYQKIQDYVQQARDGKITVEELADAIAKLEDRDIYLTTHFIETYQQGSWQGGQNEGTTVRGFASGGDPPLNQAVMVGERGPELAVFGSPTTIIPNDELRAAFGQMGSQTGASDAPVTIQIIVQGEGLSDEGAEALAWRTSEIVVERLGR